MVWPVFSKIRRTTQRMPLPQAPASEPSLLKIRTKAANPAAFTATAVAEYFLKHQSDQDHWTSHTSRPPSEASAVRAAPPVPAGLGPVIAS